MSSRILLLIMLSVSLSGFAQVFFKFGATSASVRSAMFGGGAIDIVKALASSPGVITGLAMYAVGTVVWLAVLSRTDLSQAYPFVGLSFIITAVLGYWIFHEPISAGRLLGTTLVIAGVVLVARS